MDRQYPVISNNGVNGLQFCTVLCLISLSMLLGGFLGCSRGITLAPVSGEVKLDGKPVAECAVAFAPVVGGPVASATTDAEGKFRLSTVNRPGAVPGEHYVTLTKQKMRRDSRGAEVGFEFLIPQKYSLRDTSGLRETVSEQENHFVIELSSKP